MPIGDFVVSPTDSQLLLATTSQGLARSTNGGRTFSPVPGAPAIVALVWADSGQLYAATQDGRMHASQDDGRSWSPRGRLEGAPAALTVAADVVYAAYRIGHLHLSGQRSHLRPLTPGLTRRAQTTGATAQRPCGSLFVLTTNRWTGVG